MKRYIRIYWALIRINFARLFAYRANAINAFISSFVWSCFVMISMTLLTSKSSHIYGWSRDELLVVSAVYNIIYSIFYMLFSRNFEEFSFRIHLGQLDSVLLKPISSQFFMSSWYIGFHSIVRFIVGVIFLMVILPIMHINITFVLLLRFIVLLIFSVSIIYSVWFAVMTLTIWMSHLRNLVDLLYALNGITRYPPEMYKSLTTILYLAVFPLTFVAITPAKSILNKLTFSDAMWLFAVSIVLLYLSNRFWKFALRFYTSVG